MRPEKPNLRMMFTEALEKESARARGEYLDEACDGDSELRVRLEALLSAHGAAGDFLGGEAAGSRPRDVTERPGDVIGSYKLLEELGEGGFGVVFMAEQEEPVRRRVALKILKPGMDSKQVVARFEAERQALAIMEHPSIAKVFDAGTTATGRPFFVMELVRGASITEYCDSNKLSIVERLSLFSSVCQALEHAHQKGVIHRDIKPSNILVTVDDGMPVPKVIDFGIAKALNTRLTEETLFTQLHHMIGTPAYMSPEQADMSSRDIDTRSDIYSLGVLLYELLAGYLPLDSRTLRSVGLAEVQRIIREEEPARPSTRLIRSGEASTTAARNRSTDVRTLTRHLQGDLDCITMKAMEKDRTRRYATVSELRSDITRYLRHEPVLASPPSALYRFRKFARKHRGPVAAVSAVLVVLVAGLTLSTILYFREENARIELEDALTEKDVALRNASGLYLTAQSAVELPSDPGRALLLAIEGATRREGALANDALVSALQSLHERRTWFVGTDVRALAFSPDGGRILTLSDDVWVWDTASGEPLFRLEARDGEVFLAISPDGRRLLIRTTDTGTARIWDTETGKDIASLEGHVEDEITALFDPNGAWVLIASSTGTARIWEVETGELRSTLTAREDEVFRAIDPTGKRVLTATKHGGTSRIRDAETGRDVVLDGHSDLVLCAGFSADGSRVITGSLDRTARVWNAATGTELSVLIGHEFEVLSASLGPDSVRALTSSWDATARVWDVETGAEVDQLTGHAGEVTAAAFSSDGEHVVTTSGASFDGSVRLWNISKLPEFVILPGVASAFFSRDGRTVFSASSDGTVRTWDSETGELISVKPYQGLVSRTLSVSPDGDRELIGSTDNTVIVRDLKGDKEPIILEGHAGRVLSGAFDLHGGRVATASEDHTVRVWDVETGKELTVLRGHGGAVLSASFSLDGRRVVTTSDDHTARIWDLEPHQPPVILRGHEAGVHSARFSPDGKRVVTASGDNTARIWDAETGEELLRLDGHRGDVNSACFSSDGERVVTSSADKTARIWDAASGEPLAVLRGHEREVGFACFSPDGKRIATSSTDGMAKIWPARDYLNLALAHKPRELTPDERDRYQIGTPEERARYREDWDARLRLRDEETPRKVLRTRFEAENPQNLAPSKGDVVESLPVVLRSSPFHHTDPDVKHRATHWQMRAAGVSYDTSPTMDLVSEENLERLAVSEHLLFPRTEYYWRLSYIASTGEVSDFSAETSFTTGQFEVETVRFDLSGVFNRDVVLSSGDPANDYFDKEMSYLLEEGFDGSSTGNPDAQGLPHDRLVGVHQLGEYGSLNALQTTSETKESVRLRVPRRAYSSIRFLVAGGSGDSRVPVVFEYSDGTTESTTLHCDDWFDDSPPDDIGAKDPAAVPVINGMDRWFDGDFEDANDPALFELVVPADPRKELDSILFDFGNAVYEQRMPNIEARFNLFAVTGVIQRF